MKAKSENVITYIVLPLLVGLFAFAGAAGAVEIRMIADDGVTDDRLGASVAISGDYAVAGADGDDSNGDISGSAYIFFRSGTSWTQQAKLTAGDAAANGQFGYAVAISGDYAIVGAYGDNSKGNRSGAAYIFYRSGTVWTQQAKLTANDGAATDEFGKSVAIYGDYALAGAMWDDDNGSGSGAAYMFHRSETEWTQQAKLTAGDAAADDNFGYSVAISGAYAVVGAKYDTNNEFKGGSAYIFHHYGSTWQQQAKLTATDAASYGQFGVSVAISGDYVLVGADGEDANGNDFGSAYIFYRSGSAWVQQAKLTASDGAAYDQFGNSVAISDGYVIAGAFGVNNSGSDSGAAYIFDRFDSVLVADFGASGLYGYDNLTWLQLSDKDPLEIMAADINGDGADELIASFTGLGLYIWDGWTWTKINDSAPEAMIAWDNKLVADMGSLGLWSYTMTGTGGWECLAVNDTSLLTLANVDGTGKDELAVNFTAHGLYTWDGSTWTSINVNQMDALVGWNSKLVCDIGPLGVWTYDTTHQWGCINVNDPGLMTAGSGHIAFWFSAHGMYTWDGSTWTWINENTPEAVVWRGRKLVNDFGASLGVWSYDTNGTNWFPMKTDDPNNLVVTDLNDDSQEEVTASFANGVWYNVNGSDWTQISANQAEKLVVIKSGNINQNNYTAADVNGDRKIGMEDVIYILQKVAHIR